MITGLTSEEICILLRAGFRFYNYKPGSQAVREILEKHRKSHDISEITKDLIHNS